MACRHTLKLGAFVPLLLVSVQAFGQSEPRRPQVCREVLKFAPKQTDLSDIQKQVLSRQASNARAAQRPLFIVFSTTNDDGAMAQERRIRSIESAIEALRLPGLQVEESGSADIYFTSDIYIDSCKDDPKYE